MIECNNCGTNNQVKNEYCSVCGKKLIHEQVVKIVPLNVRKKTRKFNYFNVILTLSIVLAVVGGSIYIFFRDDIQKKLDGNKILDSGFYRDSDNIYAKEFGDQVLDIDNYKVQIISLNNNYIAEKTNNSYMMYYYLDDVFKYYTYEYDDDGDELKTYLEVIYFNDEFTYNSNGTLSNDYSVISNDEILSLKNNLKDRVNSILE